ncbi:MAG TPA: hypothetical protein DCQ31_07225 [Bacteroidales bacterium]|nr:hypothetical protein [Bacteroidales bacterium]
MRTLLVIALIIALGHFENYGQENKKFSYQFNVGTSVTIPYEKNIEFVFFQPIKGSNKTDYETNLGYYAEILALYNINNKFSITSGLTYNHTSYKIKDGYVSQWSEGYLNNSYLNVPLLFNYRPSENDSFSVSVGPYFGFILFAQEKGTLYLDTSELIVVDRNDPLLQPEQKYKNDIVKDYYSIDYGILLQLSQEFRLSKEISVVIITRLNYGLRNIISSNVDTRETMHSAAVEWKNYNVLLGLGIKI